MPNPGPFAAFLKIIYLDSSRNYKVHDFIRLLNRFHRSISPIIYLDDSIKATIGLTALSKQTHGNTPQYVQ